MDLPTLNDKGAPETEWLIRWLDARFGHADYLKLNRDWKQVRFADVAREIQFLIELSKKKDTTP